jgi:hypothetical protein
MGPITEVQLTQVNSSSLQNGWKICKAFRISSGIRRVWANIAAEIDGFGPIRDTRVRGLSPRAPALLRIAIADAG